MFETLKTLPRTVRKSIRARIKLALRNPLRIAILVAALLPLWGFAHLGKRIGFVINERIQTFHELEMYEGDMAIQALRVLNGQVLYPDIKGDYIPLLYTPLYSYFHAWAMKWVDPPNEPHTIYSGRLVSLWATIGIMLILTLWVTSETGSWLSGLSAAGLFFAANPLVGWWFDIARVDMLHTLFAAAGTWAFLNKNNGVQRNEILKGILAGILFTCAFFTKQTGGQLAVGMTLLAFGISPIRAFWGMVSGLTFGGLGFLYFTVANPSFFYLCVEIPSKHHVEMTDWKLRLEQQFFGPAAFPLGLVAAWIFMSAIRRRWRHLLVACGIAWTVFFCCRGAITIGGYVNHFIPAWFFVSLGVGLASGSLLPQGRIGSKSWMKYGGILLAAVILGFVAAKKLQGAHLPIALAIGLVAAAAAGKSSLSARASWRGRASFLPVAVLSFLALDIAHHTRAVEFKIGPFKLYKDQEWIKDDVQHHIPQGLDEARQFMQGLKNLDGPVWIPHFNFYTYLVGRPTEIGTEHIRNLTLSGIPVPRYVLDVIEQKKYKYIVLSNPNVDHDWQASEIRQALKANYQLIENWDTKFGYHALRPVDKTGQKPRGLLMRKDMINTYGSGATTR